MMKKNMQDLEAKILLIVGVLFLALGAAIGLIGGKLEFLIFGAIFLFLGVLGKTHLNEKNA